MDANQKEEALKLARDLQQMREQCYRHNTISEDIYLPAVDTLYANLTTLGLNEADIDVVVCTVIDEQYLDPDFVDPVAVLVANQNLQ